MDKVGRYEFMAEPFHCDFSGRLFMGHMGNHMLNAADFHSSARGFGMKYLMSIHRSWVLSRLAIEMTEMPEQYVKFNVETWVESAMRYFTSRNFSVIGNDGHIYGYGRSIWAMGWSRIQNVLSIRVVVLKCPTTLSSCALLILTTTMSISMDISTA